MSTNRKAVLDIRVNTRCPGCENIVDLTDDPDFCIDLDVGEHDTAKSTGLDVRCPLCKQEFKVDLEL